MRYTPVLYIFNPCQKKSPGLMRLYREPYYGIQGVSGRNRGFRPGTVRTFSPRGDSFPEPSGRFPHVGIPSRNCQDVFPTWGFLPGTVRTFSPRGDSFPEPSGCFPHMGIPSRSRQDVFATLRFFVLYLNDYKSEKGMMPNDPSFPSAQERGRRGCRSICRTAVFYRLRC
jgi:hypothetical protein